MDRVDYWENIYSTGDYVRLSWYQPQLERSLELITATGINADTKIIDIGGGASTLVDGLLEKRFRQITVLDISSSALANAKARLGPGAMNVTWLEGDVTAIRFESSIYDVWHDRAVFHFLTSASDRLKYIEQAKRALKPKGHLIIATFGPNGPLKCSGLDVIRYDSHCLAAEFGDDFRLVESSTVIHTTPSGAMQEFVYCCFRKRSLC